MPPIFLSYDPVDGQQSATRLRAELEQVGLEVWPEIETTQDGKVWKEQLRQALRNISGIVVLLTPGAVTSRSVEWVWETALTLEKHVVPVLILPCEVPSELQQLPCYDLSTAQNYVLGFAALIRALHLLGASDLGNQSVSNQELLQGEGHRGITIGGNANRSTIITGNDNVIGSNNVVQRGEHNFNIRSASGLNIGDTYYNSAPATPTPAGSAERPSAVHPKTILVLAANPLDSERLALDEEVREIEEGLRRSRHRDLFKVEQRWAVRPQDLRRALLDVEPEIVHFCGHGTNGSASNSPINSPVDIRKLSVVSEATDGGGIVLEDEAGKAQLVQGQALTDLFSLFRKRLECVVLNSCYSEAQATLIVRQVPIVIGMKRAIGDRAAIEFSRGFYDALGAGRTIDEAFQFGCNAIDLQRIPEHLTPVIRHQR